jgi:hypothetical protein
MVQQLLVTTLKLNRVGHPVRQPAQVALARLLVFRMELLIRLQFMQAMMLVVVMLHLMPTP